MQFIYLFNEIFPNLSDPVQITCTIPLDDDRRYYDANFLINNANGISFKVLKRVVIILVDKDIKPLEPVAPYKPVKLPTLKVPCKVVRLPERRKQVAIFFYF